ncbi:MAG TPA: UvrD-helicase domain-containing protein, partial [Acidimicrobiales bacterium]|nr:UvrD-helicase domain-containing protein [Acidimicrobiales bacterium]
MPEFDVLASPLRVDGHDAVPRPLVVEAGAGTGKTWTLAHLATRFMVEDAVEPGEVLMVTFTRDAARELRGRVRSRLGEVRDFLAADRAPADAAEEHLASRWADAAGRAADARRARHCLADLDALHARTIHSFAAVNVTGANGRAGEDERLWRHATNLVTSRWALAEPARFDAWHAAGGEATLGAVVHALYDAGVRSGVRAPVVRVLPDADGTGSDDALAATQRDLALDVIARYGDLARRAGRTSFADLLVALAGRLDQRDADRFRSELRASYRVVMIDEFQDTDPLQWHVFSWLFADAPETRLVVVGDPKQAIYGFRSGSVETFLDVEREARVAGQATATLTTSRRSTPGLVDALNRLFDGTDFHYGPTDADSEDSIPFTEARASRPDAPSPLAALDPAPLHLRVGPYSAGADDRVLDEVADYVELARAAGVPYHEIAVLCRTNPKCDDVQRHLVRRGLPAVTSSGPSIFECEAARQLRWLLIAAESPEDAGLTEGLRATWFRGPEAADPASAELATAVAA